MATGDTSITCTVSPCNVVISFDLPLLNIDPAAAFTLSASIVGVWAVGFAFRALIQVFKDDSLPQEMD